MERKMGEKAAKGCPQWFKGVGSINDPRAIEVLSQAIQKQILSGGTVHRFSRFEKLAADIPTAPEWMLGVIRTHQLYKLNPMTISYFDLAWEKAIQDSILKLRLKKDFGFHVYLIELRAAIVGREVLSINLIGVNTEKLMEQLRSEIKRIDTPQYEEFIELLGVPFPQFCRDALGSITINQII